MPIRLGQKGAQLWLPDQLVSLIFFFEVTLDCGHFDRAQDAFVKNRQAMLITSLLKGLLN